MANTRTSPRQAAKSDSSPDSAKGVKRKAESSPAAKQPAKQTKIDDVLPSADDKGKGKAKDVSPSPDAGKDDEASDSSGAMDVSSNNDQADQEKKEETANEANHGDTEGAVEQDEQRKKASSSNVLERGMIYFFTRGRVGVDDPDSVQDLQRSFFVMRPLPPGAKLNDGAIQDVSNNRLLALPKKVWPRSGKDKFMVFVEKAAVSMDTLKEEFFSGSEYSTKTTGVRQNHNVTPVGEGVYAMYTSSNTTHLSYMLTIPSEAGEVQEDIGIKAKGSFVLSLKNPESGGPAYAQLPEKPDWPKEFIDEFRGRGWMPAAPKHLNYANAQVLLIGEDFESSSVSEPAPQDEKKEEKETPQEELEQLEEEDEHRVENFKGDETVFEDLGISSKDYPKVMTTW